MKRKVFKVAVTLGAIAGLISPMAQPFTSGAQETIQSLEKVKMSEDGEYQGFSYTHYFHTNEVSIWGYSGEDEALVNWKGTEKNLWCCPRKSGITSIKIPSDVDFVHDYAFYKKL